MSHQSKTSEASIAVSAGFPKEESLWLAFVNWIIVNWTSFSNFRALESLGPPRSKLLIL